MNILSSRQAHDRESVLNGLPLTVRHADSHCGHTMCAPRTERERV